VNVRMRVLNSRAASQARWRVAWELIGVGLRVPVKQAKLNRTIWFRTSATVANELC
jgi:hypothetical protein